MHKHVEKSFVKCEIIVVNNVPLDKRADEQDMAKTERKKRSEKGKIEIRREKKKKKSNAFGVYKKKVNAHYVSNTCTVIN